MGVRLVASITVEAAKELGPWPRGKEVIAGGPEGLRRSIVAIPGLTRGHLLGPQPQRHDPRHGLAMDQPQTGPATRDPGPGGSWFISRVTTTNP